MSNRIAPRCAARTEKMTGNNSTSFVARVVRAVWTDNRSADEWGINRHFQGAMRAYVHYRIHLDLTAHHR